MSGIDELAISSRRSRRAKDGYTQYRDNGEHGGAGFLQCTALAHVQALSSGWCGVQSSVSFLAGKKAIEPRRNLVTVIVVEVEEALEDDGQDNWEYQAPQTLELGHRGCLVFLATRLVSVWLLIAWFISGLLDTWIRGVFAFVSVLRIRTVFDCGIARCDGERLGLRGDVLALCGGGRIGDLKLVRAWLGKRPIGVGVRSKSGLDGVVTLGGIDQRGENLAQAFGSEKADLRTLWHLYGLDVERDSAVFIVLVVEGLGVIARPDDALFLSCLLYTSPSPRD